MNIKTLTINMALPRMSTEMQDRRTNFMGALKALECVSDYYLQETRADEKMNLGYDMLWQLHALERRMMGNIAAKCNISSSEQEYDYDNFTQTLIQKLLSKDNKRDTADDIINIARKKAKAKAKAKKSMH